MPCRDYDSDVRLVDNPELKEKLDKTTRLLCFLCGKLELSNIFVPDREKKTLEELQEWWKEHQEQDRVERKRLQAIEARKRLKANALAKLSTQEKKILGLDY